MYTPVTRRSERNVGLGLEGLGYKSPLSHIYLRALIAQVEKTLSSDFQFSHELWPDIIILNSYIIY